MPVFTHHSCQFKCQLCLLLPCPSQALHQAHFAPVYHGDLGLCCVLEIVGFPEADCTVNPPHVPSMCFTSVGVHDQKQVEFPDGAKKHLILVS